jgi:hypothetical protein
MDEKEWGRKRGCNTGTSLEVTHPNTVKTSPRLKIERNQVQNPNQGGEEGMKPQKTNQVRKEKTGPDKGVKC